MWKELASRNGLMPEEANVMFENVKFKRTTPLTSTDFVKLVVMIFDKSGYFEVIKAIL